MFLTQSSQGSSSSSSALSAKPRQATQKSLLSEGEVWQRWSLRLERALEVSEEHFQSQSCPGFRNAEAHGEAKHETVDRVQERCGGSLPVQKISSQEARRQVKESIRKGQLGAAPAGGDAAAAAGDAARPTRCPGFPRSPLTPLALRNAVLTEDVAEVKRLLEAGVSANWSYPVGSDEAGVEFVTALHMACWISESPRAEMVQALLKGGANLNPRSSRGVTPLMCACLHKNVGAARILLEWSAEVSPIDHGGSDCLTLAMNLSQMEPKFLRDLLALRREVLESEAQTGQPARGQESPKSLSDDDADAEPPWRPGLDRYGELLLRESLASALDGAGGGQGPLTLKQRGEVSARLVRAILFCAARRGSYCMEVAAEVASARRLNEILAQGAKAQADPDATSTRASVASASTDAQAAAPGQALRVAVLEGNHAAAEVLLEFGQRAEWLHEAVRGGSLELVQVLLRHRADPLLSDEFGETPLDVAVELHRGAGPMVEALREALDHMCLA